MPLEAQLETFSHGDAPDFHAITMTLLVPDEATETDAYAQLPCVSCGLNDPALQVRERGCTTADRIVFQEPADGQKQITASAQADADADLSLAACPIALPEDYSIEPQTHRPAYRLREMLGEYPISIHKDKGGNIAIYMRTKSRGIRSISPIYFPPQPNREEAPRGYVLLSVEDEPLEASKGPPQRQRSITHIRLVETQQGGIGLRVKNPKGNVVPDEIMKTTLTALEMIDLYKQIPWRERLHGVLSWGANRMHVEFGNPDDNALHEYMDYTKIRPIIAAYQEQRKSPQS